MGILRLTHYCFNFMQSILCLTHSLDFKLPEKLFSLLTHNIVPFIKMLSLKCTVLIAIVAIASSTLCPTWFIRESNRCICGKQFKNILECSQVLNETRISENYCLTYNNNTAYFGACPYNTNGLWRAVPSDVSQLDEAMCGPLNRTGLLCSQCQPGLGPAVFSHYNECKECMKWPYGWIVYFVRLTVPLTLFCVIVIIFHINIASPPLNGLVLIAQILGSFLKGDPSFVYNIHGESYTIEKFVIDFYGIFTLDFFVNLIPSFCIHKGMNMPTVIALDYLAALYPIILTVIIYLCISLHDKGNKLLIVCWKPFHKCLARFRQSWNSKGSVLMSFSTFLLLSHCKICLASINLTQFITARDKFGNSTYYRMYFDAAYELHKSWKYIEFVALALTISITIVFLPALFVLFYQNRFFQRCLSYCRFRFTMIHELANITQGCFKNDTSPGTRDYRWFAGLYMLVRFIMIGTVIQKYHLLVYVTLLTAVAVLVAGLCPYKKNWYNVTDAILWSIFALGMAWFDNFAAYGLKLNVLLCLIGSIPFVGISFVACWRVIACILTWCRACFVPKSTASGDPEDELPHRLLSPNQYTPLI